MQLPAVEVGNPGDLKRQALSLLALLVARLARLVALLFHFFCALLLLLLHRLKTLCKTALLFLSFGRGLLRFDLLSDLVFVDEELFHGSYLSDGDDVGHEVVEAQTTGVTVKEEQHEQWHDPHHDPHVGHPWLGGSGLLGHVLVGIDEHRPGHEQGEARDMRPPKRLSKRLSKRLNSSLNSSLNVS